MESQPRGIGEQVKISVIICAYTLERWDELLAAVAAVQAQSLAPYEVILVIDHNPELFERAQQAFPGVTVLSNQQRKGLSGARNTGVLAATGDILAFVDEDAVPEPDWLVELAAGYQHPEVLGVGGRINPLWINARPGWFPSEFDWVVGCTYLGIPGEVSTVRNLIGCNMSFRREVFASAGGFREGIGRIGSFPAGGEETEFCIRVRQRQPHGIFLFNPAAQVQHRVPSGRAQPGYFWKRCFVEGLSKAQITRLVGVKDGLGAERRHTLRVLPAGILRGLADASKGDFGGLQRAAMILFGFLVTSSGYALGKLGGFVSSHQHRAEPLTGKWGMQE